MEAREESEASNGRPPKERKKKKLTFFSLFLLALKSPPSPCSPSPKSRALPLFRPLPYLAGGGAQIAAPRPYRSPPRTFPSVPARATAAIPASHRRLLLLFLQWLLGLRRFLRSPPSSIGCLAAPPPSPPPAPGKKQASG